MFRPCLLLLTGLFAAAISRHAQAQSFYPVRLEDKTAVYLSNDRFGTKGDGVADDTGALQKAIDTVADTTHQGIVFIPEGRYRLTHVICLAGDTFDRLWNPASNICARGQHSGLSDRAVVHGVVRWRQNRRATSRRLATACECSSVASRGLSRNCPSSDRRSGCKPWHVLFRHEQCGL
jgi:hypothetical protein